MLSERIFFVTERITDILNFENEILVRYSNDVRSEIKVRFSDDVREAIMELYKELSPLVDYLRHVEESEIDEQLLDHHRFYVEISSIAESCDNILGRVISFCQVDIANDVCHLVKKISNSYKLLPSQPNYYYNTSGNTNMSYGNQRIGPIYISIGPSDSSKKKPFLRPKTYGHVPNSDFVGFNHEVQTLLTHLIQPHNETHVVGIVGMGGSGKTTLARHIYHHPQIRTHFHRKIWVCISQSWDKTSILNSIRRRATQNPGSAEMGYDQVVELLSQHLSSQSYLVILDDIWSVDAWNYIFPGLPHNSGSKVVITTRNIGVPKCIDPSVIIMEPKPLNDEQSLALFARRTFLPNENISDVLQQLGAKMVKKCKGLPLAITALAGILRMDKSQNSWERINKRLAHSILNMDDASTQGVVKEVLGLSYYELPHHLKPCVLYLHIFPDDYEIRAEKLKKLWIAECLIKRR